MADFLAIFLNFPAHVCVPYTLDISPKYLHFSIFERNIDDFSNIKSIFWPTNFWLAKSYQYWPISNISTIYRSIKLIFSSLLIFNEWICNFFFSIVGVEW